MNAIYVRTTNTGLKLLLSVWLTLDDAVFKTNARAFITSGEWSGSDSDMYLYKINGWGWYPLSIWQSYNVLLWCRFFSTTAPEGTRSRRSSEWNHSLQYSHIHQQSAQHCMTHQQLIAHIHHRSKVQAVYPPFTSPEEMLCRERRDFFTQLSEWQGHLIRIS